MSFVFNSEIIHYNLLPEIRQYCQSIVVLSKLVITVKLVMTTPHTGGSGAMSQRGEGHSPD